MLTRSEKVKEFTEASMDMKMPSRPRKMTREEVFFVVRMNCEELQELLMTVIKPDENVKEVLQNIVSLSIPPIDYNFDKTDVELIAEQVDAVVDIDYYNCNAACKAGQNVDQIFDMVHEANMNKKFPDGEFHRNHIGKVIKPPGWQEPIVTDKVLQWMKNGSWENN